MRPRRPRATALSAFPVLIALSGLSGCEEPIHTAGGARKPAAAPKTKAEDTFIVGQKTTDIRNAATEVKQKGAVVTTPRITAKDPITLQGNAYVTMIGQTSIMKIDYAMKLYQGEHDKYPATYEEFKKEILEPNQIALPKLPSYQEYGYNEKEHKLVILEYPDRKK